MTTASDAGGDWPRGRARLAARRAVRGDRGALRAAAARGGVGRGRCGRLGGRGRPPGGVAGGRGAGDRAGRGRPDAGERPGELRARANSRWSCRSTATGMLHGLRLAPAAAEWAPPHYAAPRRFTEREVTVGAGPLAVPGTLTLPRAAPARRPGVVLLSGGGPFDRDETSGPNKPLKDLAWGLASRGVAVLRFDKVTFAHAGQVAHEPRLHGGRRVRAARGRRRPSCSSSSRAWTRRGSSCSATAWAARSRRGWPRPSRRSPGWCCWPGTRSRCTARPSASRATSPRCGPGPAARGRRRDHRAAGRAGGQPGPVARRRRPRSCRSGCPALVLAGPARLRPGGDGGRRWASRC